MFANNYPPAVPQAPLSLTPHGRDASVGECCSMENMGYWILGIGVVLLVIALVMKRARQS